MRRTFLSLFNANCAAFPDKCALTYLEGGEKESARLTFSELKFLALALALGLRSEGLQPGDRVLIALSSGADALAVFIACLYAGFIPILTKAASNKTGLVNLAGVVGDALPKVVFSERSLESLLGHEPDLDTEALRSVLQLQWLPKPELGELREVMADLGGVSRDEQVSPDDIAFLQYTSGSLGNPKGVCVTHGNLVANITMMQQSAAISQEDVFLTWLPLYHDMGLVGNALLALGVGASLVMMPPVSFAMRPIRWLLNIVKYRATVTGGPNFAYRSLVASRVIQQAQGLDLSSLRVLYCGSEPISPQTVRTFLQAYAANGLPEQAFFPCYGMAEATLMLSGGPVARGATFSRFAPRIDSAVADSESVIEKEVIGCGQIMCQEMLIVDPVTRQPVAEGEEAEIWVRGDSIAAGYWNNPEASREVFQAELATAPGVHYLRTGDLGFLRGGEVYVNGRLKEIIIYNGSNYYPQDIEQCAAQLVDPKQEARAACFSSLRDDMENVVIFQEIPQGVEAEQHAYLVELIKKGVYRQFAIPLSEVVLIRRNSIPRTTSGKICRLACRRLYAHNEHQHLVVTV